MPQLDFSTTVQLFLLLSALPAQYFITRYSSFSQHQSQKALKDLVSQAQKYGTEYLSWPSWKKWCSDVYKSVLAFYNSQRWSDDPVTSTDADGESPAIEVMILDSSEGYFAKGPHERKPRRKHVQFRVGQVVTHKTWKYRGVIIGWDQYAKAPPEWLEKNHPKGKENWRTQPNYAILVDTRDRKTPQMTYVPQENLELAINEVVIHPSIQDYFDGFDGQQYVKRPALKKLYPED